MRGLKILVVVMGVMLVLGFAILLAAIAGRISRGSPSPSTPRQVQADAIVIPRGARVEAMTAGTDRLIVALELPEGRRQLLIIDLATGARLGAIDLQPAP
jgi:Family of unknown function (DUF6476)